jgi:glyceraldehyde 3-phosphate dehydrogenase
MAPSIDDVAHGQVQATSACTVGINGFGRIGKAFVQTTNTE